MSAQRGLAVVIVAGGNASRFGEDKMMLPWEDTRVIVASVRPFVVRGEVDQVVVVAPKGRGEEYRKLFDDLTNYNPWSPSHPIFNPNPLYPNGREAGRYVPITVVEGGDSRSSSVRAGLEAVETTLVLIHDGARPNVGDELIERVISTLNAHPDHGVVPVVPVSQSVLKQDGGVEYLDRTQIYEVQTPQGFDTAQLKQAIEQGDYTDEGSAYAKSHPILTVEGEPANRKLTYPMDYYGMVGETRQGVGYDIHRLTAGDKLWLGGYPIEEHLRLVGHSDADVVLHAVMDALLSTAGLPDIGHLFPTDDPQWEGAASSKMLAIVMDKVAKEGITPIGLSVAIVAERPYLNAYKGGIVQSLAALLHLPIRAVGVTATTNEDVFFEEPKPKEGMAQHIAAKDAIAAFANVTVRVR